MTPELIASIIALIGAITAFVKSQADKNKIQVQRTESHKSYNEKLLLLTQRMDQCEKRLDDGNNKFNMLDKRLDDINGTLKELKGMFAMYLKMREEENR